MYNVNIISINVYIIIKMHNNFIKIIIYVYFYILLIMGIGDWGLGPIPNPQSPIPNPQSPT